MLSLVSPLSLDCRGGAASPLSVYPDGGVFATPRAAPAAAAAPVQPVTPVPPVQATETAAPVQPAAPVPPAQAAGSAVPNYAASAAAPQPSAQTVVPPAASYSVGGAPVRPAAPAADKNAPLTMGQYLLQELLSLIPVANIVLLILWSFSDEGNTNRKNWARAKLIWIKKEKIRSNSTLIVVIAVLGSTYGFGS